MIVLEPKAHETIWGGNRLTPYSNTDSRNIGHLYSLCCEKGLETKILNGSYKGYGFQTYFEENKHRFGLSNYREFPLILALVEAKDDLSIQVHPDDEMAVKEEGAAYGKNESWYFIDTPDEGVIYNGCLADNNDEVKRKIENGQMMSIVDRLPVKAGDYVYVEAGTLHAMTAGSFVYEIEENSPWTYRLYDYDRKDEKGNGRQLHLEKGLKALNTSLKSQSRVMGDHWIDERRYRLLKLVGAGKHINSSKTLQCLTFITGKAEADGISCSTGSTVVLEPGECLEGKLELVIVAEPK